MIVFCEIEGPGQVSGAPSADSTLTLPFQDRRRSRQRARLDGGEVVALLLPRGAALRDGAVLRSASGRRVRVHAANESVSRVVSSDLLLLTRAAYHLGNRHIAVQVEAGCLSYLHDHVLDALVRGLGLPVTVVDAPFEPESGAYSGAHAHAHDAHDAHEHAHDAHAHDDHAHGDHAHAVPGAELAPDRPDGAP